MAALGEVISRREAEYDAAAEMFSIPKGFNSLGEFAVAVVNFARTDAGLKDHRLVLGAATGAGSAIPSAGGFAVPDQYASDLWMAVYDTSRLLRLCDRQPMVTERLKLPAIDETSRATGSRHGAARTYWMSAEGVAPTASKPQFRLVELELRKLLALIYATNELVQDVPALGAWLRRIFGLEAAFEIEDAIINGSGTDRPLGLLNSDALISVAAESGQAAGTVVTANVEGMWERLWAPSRRTAIWLAAPGVERQLQGLTISSGTSVAQLLTYGPDGARLLGRPYFETEYNPSIGSAGDLILMDPSAYLIGEQAPEFVSSIHAQFVEDETLFKFRYRVDGGPAWRTPITPKNSNTTQSPYIALAARE
ncbi:MAG: phage major capsid protein [Alphaproteobacteria bacterium]